jgi:hypothetical protein
MTALVAGACGQVVSPYTNQNAPVEVCFAKGTDPEYMAKVRALIAVENAVFSGVTDYHVGNRWPGNLGTPVNLTWSFVPDGLQIPGSTEPASPSVLFAKMDAAFAGQGGRAAWIAQFQKVLDRWSEVAGVHYQRVTFGGNDWDDGAAFGQAGLAGHRGDMRISMHSIDGPDGILAYNFFPTSGDMVMDADDIAFFSDPTGAFQNFHNTVGHEHGHGLGLDHTCSQNSHILMEPVEEGGYDGPQEDDIRAVERLYGDRFEPNDTAATATPIGALTPGSTVTFGSITTPTGWIAAPNASVLSIDAAGAVDWYSFTVANQAPAQVTVTPVGSTYDDSPEGASGCPGTVTNFNALTVADLAMQVFGNNGGSLLGTSSSAGLGLPESLTTSTLSPGTYQIKVYAVNSPAQSQLYKISLACPKPTITTPPAATNAYAGNTVTLSVVAANGDTYRWRKGGINVLEGGNISGSSTPTLTISPATMGDSGLYSVAVSNGCGTTVTAAATLTVDCYPNCDGSTTPPILNMADFTCFIQRFNSADPWANCDGSTTVPTLNILDFVCFQQRMAAGCP